MIVSPAAIRGRMRTALGAVFKRTALKRARSDAWQSYTALQTQLTLSTKADASSNRLARFAHNVKNAGLPSPVRYLEIGSFEGASLAHIYTLLNGNVRITAIDPFQDYSELPGLRLASIEEVFRANVRAIGADKAVRLLKGRSIDHLPKLFDDGESFDLIFIDGSHAMLDVMVDAVLAWRLLAPAGLMIFDDYLYAARQAGRLYRPKPAIDAFIGMMAGELDVIDVAAQVFVRRK
jgi:predicted O-methyltransferase YrrM